MNTKNLIGMANLNCEVDDLGNLRRVEDVCLRKIEDINKRDDDVLCAFRSFSEVDTGQINPYTSFIVLDLSYDQLLALLGDEKTGRVERDFRVYEGVIVQVREETVSVENKLGHVKSDILRAGVDNQQLIVVIKGLLAGIRMCRGSVVARIAVARALIAIDS